MMIIHQIHRSQRNYGGTFRAGLVKLILRSGLLPLIVPHNCRRTSLECSFWKSHKDHISKCLEVFYLCNQVPQQKNDFDCGPFVLFFIKRFIEEAPQRLKRKDVGMVSCLEFYTSTKSLYLLTLISTCMFPSFSSTRSGSNPTKPLLWEPKF